MTFHKEDNERRRRPSQRRPPQSQLVSGQSKVFDGLPEIGGNHEIDGSTCDGSK
ncbi:hypothetical protein M413DRAFT_437963 [Hebeloma cylindrosporum]|uniref:Uncharacterized protein n=1 Tax=Hebeloma cylindrosporum TaxID=76867 RepID=A0A0C3CXA5_HEBCY|nr:hypothetical protein M413DRAFT_437963 [Hebeloma cylindrosporum h7]